MSNKVRVVRTNQTRSKLFFAKIFDLFILIILKTNILRKKTTADVHKGGHVQSEYNRYYNSKIFQAPEKTKKQKHNLPTNLHLPVFCVSSPCGERWGGTR